MRLKTTSLALLFFTPLVSFAANTGIVGRELGTMDGPPRADLPARGIIQSHKKFGYALYRYGKRTFLCLTSISRTGAHSVIAAVDTGMVERQSLGTSETNGSIHCSNSDTTETDSYYFAIVKNSDLKHGVTIRPVKAWKVDFSMKAFLPQTKSDRIHCEYENQD